MVEKEVTVMTARQALTAPTICRDSCRAVAPELWLLRGPHNLDMQ
jgi:hypothetical protein